MRQHIFYNEGTILGTAGTVAKKKTSFSEREGTGDCDVSRFPIDIILPEMGSR